MSTDNDKPMQVKGIMVKAPLGRIRLILSELVLDVDLNDVLSVETLAPPPGLVTSRARKVRAHLQAGARLHGIGLAEPYLDQIWDRGRLFALETRHSQTVFSFADEFVAEERAFFAERKISAEAGGQP